MNQLSKNTPSEEQLRYRRSEEFCNHQFGMWTDKGEWCMHCVNPETGQHYHYSSEDERILLKAGYTEDDFEWLIQNSPRAKRNKIEFDLINARLDARDEYKEKHKVAIRLLYIPCATIGIILLPILLCLFLIEHYTTCIVIKSTIWICQWMISLPFRLYDRQMLDYCFNLDSCPWKERNDEVNGDENNDEEDNIGCEYREKVFEPLTVKGKLRIIFLDFDGVMDSYRNNIQLRRMKLPEKDKFGTIFDPYCVENLKRIIDTTGANIVISSSWKDFMTLEEILEMWKLRNLPGEVIDTTPTCSRKRGDEIDRWIKKINNDCDYVIIDDMDESQFNEHQYSHLFRVSRILGLDSNTADKIIEKFNS